MDDSGRDLPLQHLILHQFDPEEHVAGGVHGFITDLVRFAPDGHAFRVVGVDAGGERRRAVWQQSQIGGKPILFLPVARLSAGRGERRIPHSLRLTAGFLARRPRAGAAFVHAHRAETAMALSLAYPTSPLINFVHTDSHEALRHRTEIFWRFAPPGLLVALESAATRRSARTWVFSEAAAERLGRVSPGVRTGRNWYDSDVFSPPDRRDRRPLTVGWIGRMEPSKNPLKAVNVFRELAAMDVDFEAWFAGSGTLEAAVEAQVGGYGLDDRVSMHGTVSTLRLAALLRDTDVLLVTSLWEGQPRAVLEALGSGVAVVSTPVGDMAAIVREGVSGFVAEDGTESALTQLIIRATRLRDRGAIAETVAPFRAREVIGSMFAELEALAQAPRARAG